MAPNTKVSFVVVRRIFEKYRGKNKCKQKAYLLNTGRDFRLRVYVGIERVKDCDVWCLRRRVFRPNERNTYERIYIRTIHHFVRRVITFRVAETQFVCR